MSFLDNIFGGGKNPAEAAQPWLNKIPGVGHEYYDPYVNQGREAGNKTQEEYMRLMNDPTALINEIMQKYHTSESYGQQRDILNKELGATAAAGGVAGTPLDQQNRGTAIQGLLSGDMQQFLSNALGLYNTGLTGEQGKENMGYDASKGLADLLGQNYATSAGLQFQGQSQNNANRGAAFEALTKALAAGAGAYFNPVGTAAGAVKGAANAVAGAS